MIICESCGKRIHGIIPFGTIVKCKECDYQFINYNNIKKVDKEYDCQICHKKQSTNHKNICDDCYNESIKNDYEKNLPKHKPYKCLQCGKRFGQPTNSFIHKCRGKKI